MTDPKDVPTEAAAPDTRAAAEKAGASLAALSLHLDAATLQAMPADAADTLRAAQQILSRYDRRRAGPGRAGTGLFFDVSDLLGYFPDNRLPTGVQRVQISTIGQILKGPDGSGVTLCRFVEDRDEWHAVPHGQFLSVCALSMAEGDMQAPHWRAEVAGLESAIRSGPILTFPHGACLVNLGTSWWLPNYFMYIRQAKQAFGIRYVPLIHDMIPAMMPEHCARELVEEFIDWLGGVLGHADGVPGGVGCRPRRT